MQTCALIHVGVTCIGENFSQQRRTNALTYDQLLLLCNTIFLMGKKKGN